MELGVVIAHKPPRIPSFPQGSHLAVGLGTKGTGVGDPQCLSPRRAVFPPLTVPQGVVFSPLLFTEETREQQVLFGFPAYSVPPEGKGGSEGPGREERADTPENSAQRGPGKGEL